MEFYSNFLEQCAIKGVSPTAAAVGIGLSNAAASGWKTGKQPSDVTLAKLAKYFNCSVSDLTSEQKEKPTASGELSDACRDLLAAVDDMTDEQIYKILEIIKQVKSL